MSYPQCDSILMTSVFYGQATLGTWEEWLALDLDCGSLRAVGDCSSEKSSDWLHPRQSTRISDFSAHQRLLCALCGGGSRNKLKVESILVNNSPHTSSYVLLPSALSKSVVLQILYHAVFLMINNSVEKKVKMHGDSDSIDSFRSIRSHDRESKNKE
jgi:hypothetical protein